MGISAKPSAVQSSIPTIMDENRSYVIQYFSDQRRNNLRTKSHLTYPGTAQVCHYASILQLKVTAHNVVLTLNAQVKVDFLIFKRR